MQAAPGMMVTANVRLERPLGQGAMGAVWVAEHLTLKTKVAVKFISAQLAADPNVMARFTQEASVAAQIKSPHVVQTFDQGVMPDGTPYIVMELLEGESLMERLERGGRLSLQETATVVLQVARALNKAHALGIVHRDIKPDNIFITPGDDGPLCKILDFGIAKQTQLPKMGGLTNAGMMVGTPEFMSPEQVLSAKDVDFRADLWGLAVTTYLVLTNELPFTAEALGTLCVKLLDGKFTPATQLRADLPHDVDVWFKKAMAHEPKDRFASAREMADVFVTIVSTASGELPSSPLSGFTPPPGSAALQAVIDEPPPPGTTGLQDTERPPRVAPSETLTGSSANRRRDEGGSKWMIGFGAGLAVAVIGVGLFALSGRDPEPASDGAPTTSAEVQPPTTAETATPEPTATAETTANASADPSSTASAEASGKPPVQPPTVQPPNMPWPKPKATSNPQPGTTATSKPAAKPQPGTVDHGF